MVIKLQPFTVDDIITVGIAVNFMEEQGTVECLTARSSSHLLSFNALHQVIKFIQFSRHLYVFTLYSFPVLVILFLRVLVCSYMNLTQS